MKSKLTIALLISALLSTGAAWSGQGQTDKSKNVAFEYQVIADPTAMQGQDAGLKTLNNLGSQGWEITGVVQHGENPPMLYLKRFRKPVQATTRSVD